MHCSKSSAVPESLGAPIQQRLQAQPWHLTPFSPLKAKEKRGWTLNSAGYLLGPHAVGNHRSFSDKNGLTSKRELQPQDDVKPGSFDRSMPENNIMRTIIEFLSFLHLKEAGAFDRLPDLPAAASSEDIERS
uniref:Galanin peptides n=1 Tax=Mandrillus leucophaeus TaxID=9568 RepID=A0A2K5Y1X9_MANLE